MSKVLLCLKYILFIFFSVANCRQYDMNEESIKLFGESFQTVISRFRQTPEYIKILEKKKRDLKDQFSTMHQYAFHHYVSEMLKSLRPVAKQAQGRVPTKQQPAKSMGGLSRRGVGRQGTEDVPTTPAFDPVKTLDDYWKNVHTNEKFYKKSRQAAIDVTSKLLQFVIYQMGGSAMDLSTKPDHQSTHMFDPEEDKHITDTTQPPHSSTHAMGCDKNGSGEGCDTKDSKLETSTLSTSTRAFECDNNVPGAECDDKNPPDGTFRGKKKFFIRIKKYNLVPKIKPLNSTS